MTKRRRRQVARPWVASAETKSARCRAPATHHRGWPACRAPCSCYGEGADAIESVLAAGPLRLGFDEGAVKVGRAGKGGKGGAR